MGDFVLDELWEYPLRAIDDDGEDFAAFCAVMETFAFAGPPPGVAGALFRFRGWIGRLLGWDREGAPRPLPGCDECSLRERLSANERPPEERTRPDAMGFSLVYEREDERLLEISPLARDPFELYPGQEESGYVEMRNTGNAPWMPGVTNLGTTEPRDVASPIAGSDWLSPNRAATIDRVVNPGEKGRFLFSVCAPDTLGDHSQFFNLVQEGVAWFSDQGGPPDAQLQVRVTVVPSPPCADGIGPAWQCDGSDRVRCEYGEVLRETCERGCSDGTCEGTPTTTADAGPTHDGGPTGTSGTADPPGADPAADGATVMGGCSVGSAASKAGRWPLAALVPPLLLLLIIRRRRLTHLR